MKYKIITIFTLLLAFVLANVRFNSKLIPVPEINKVFPQKIGNWEGKDIKPEKNVYSLLRENELLLRNYKNIKNNREISLAIVLTTARDRIHDPHLCYRSQGLIIKHENDKIVSPDEIVKYVDCKKNGQKCNMIFWYTDFKKTYSDRAKFMLNVIFSKFFDKPIKGLALVVIISPAAETENDKLELIHFSNDVKNTLYKALN